MLLPFILGILVTVLGVVGVGAIVDGTAKFSEADKRLKVAKERYKKDIKRLEKENALTTAHMDKLGELELRILKSFEEFTEVFERIKNKPVFAPYSKNGITLPKYDGEEIKSASVGAYVILGALGVATMGVFIGGIFFDIAASSASQKVEEIEAQVSKVESEINQACKFLRDLRELANRYYETLSIVDETYRKHLEELKKIVYTIGKTGWNDFTEREKTTTENTVLLVTLLYNMCKVNLVLKAQEKGELNSVNNEEATKALALAETILGEKFNITVIN